MRILAFAVTLFIAATSLPAAAQHEWDFWQNTQYQQYHDVARIQLKDGRTLDVLFDQYIGLEEIDTWQPGRLLALVYRQGQGVALLDVASQHAIPVLSGWGTHPIEVLLERCTEKNPSTLGISECNQAAEKMWDGELNLAYARLLAQTGRHGRLALKTAQREWGKFRDSQIRAVQAVYGTREGTVQTIIAADQIMQITREQALRLNSMLEQ